MKKVPVSLSKPRLAVFLLIPVFFSFIITSCGGGGGGGSTADCITMTRLQIKTWLQPGWNTPGDSNFVPMMNFVPGQDAEAIKVDGYPLNNDTVVQTNKLIPFTIKVLNPPCSYPSGLTVRQQFYNFSQQGFADGSGNLIQFTYLRLRPRPYSGDSTLMSFDVEIVTKSGEEEVVTGKGETYPCPPHCPTPAD